MDNWYSSPQLYDHLHENKTNTCGTVRRNRKGMPKLKKKLEKGQTDSRSTDKMMAIRWLDRREVCMLTTLYSNTMRPTGKMDRQTKQPIVKPNCVIGYNKNMGAFDRTDMMIVSIECVRKSLKWYRKLFLHLLDITLLNSHALFNVKTGQNISLANFQLQLIREIIQKYHVSRPSSKRGRPSANDQPLGLIERHFPSPVPDTAMCVQTQQLAKKKDERAGTCVPNVMMASVYTPVSKNRTLVRF
jgi:hypothetical protein